jgi:hypothetical protein
MTPTGKAGGTAGGKPQSTPRPKGRAKLIVAAAAIVVLGGYAWLTRGAEAWIEVAPLEMRLSVGASQGITVALKYKPPFRLRTSARSIAGTVQLISFPTAVDVTPTSIVTTGAEPETTLRVTGLKPGQEELVVAASNTPADMKSWQTTSVMVIVTR